MDGAVFPPCMVGVTVVMTALPWKDLCQHARPCSQCPWLQGRPLLTHSSTRDSILTGVSGSVYFGVTSPFSWVLVHSRFCLWPPRVCFPSPPCWASPLSLDVEYLVFGGIQHSPVNVQWLVAILEFSQGKMSTLPSTPPSWKQLHVVVFKKICGTSILLAIAPVYIPIISEQWFPFLHILNNIYFLSIS